MSTAFITRLERLAKAKNEEEAADLEEEQNVFEKQNSSTYDEFVSYLVCNTHDIDELLPQEDVRAFFFYKTFVRYLQPKNELR